MSEQHDRVARYVDATRYDETKAPYAFSWSDAETLVDEWETRGVWLRDCRTVLRQMVIYLQHRSREEFEEAMHPTPGTRSARIVSPVTPDLALRLQAFLESLPES